MKSRDKLNKSFMTNVHLFRVTVAVLWLPTVSSVVSPLGSSVALWVKLMYSLKSAHTWIGSKSRKQCVDNSNNHIYVANKNMIVK